MTWFVLALIATLIFAIIYILDDNLVAHVYPNPVFAVIISGFFNLWPLVFSLVVPVNLPAIDNSVLWFALAAGIITQFSIYLYFYAYRYDTPSAIATVDNITPALVPFAAYLLIGERLTTMQYAGMVTILVASLGVTSPSLRNLGRSPALGLILGSAALAAPAVVMQKFVYAELGLWTGFVLFVSGTAICSLGLLWLTPQGRSFTSDFMQRFRPGWFLAAALAETLAVIAFYIQHMAIAKGPVSLVMVICGTTTVFVLITGCLFYPFWPRYFRDYIGRHSFRKLIFILIMLGGLYLVRINGG